MVSTSSTSGGPGGLDELDQRWSGWSRQARPAVVRVVSTSSTSGRAASRETTWIRADLPRSQPRPQPGRARRPKLGTRWSRYARWRSLLDHRAAASRETTWSRADLSRSQPKAATRQGPQPAATGYMVSIRASFLGPTRPTGVPRSSALLDQPGCRVPRPYSTGGADRRGTRATRRPGSAPAGRRAPGRGRSRQEWPGRGAARGRGRRTRRARAARARAGAGRRRAAR